MANEATVRSGLTIRKNNLHYQSLPQAFQADLEGTKGPTPSAITVSVDGTNVDLSELGRPGLCHIVNMEPAGGNFVTVGIWDSEQELFFPLLELLPGEAYTVRLSRYLQEEFVGTGTGTGVIANNLRVKADTAACVVRVDAFEA